MMDRYNGLRSWQIVTAFAVVVGLPQGASASIVEVTTERGCFTTLDDKIAVWDIEGIANPSSGAAPSANTAAVSDTSGFEAILKDFRDAVAEGREPLVSGPQAAMATDLVLKIYGR